MVVVVEEEEAVFIRDSITNEEEEWSSLVKIEGDEEAAYTRD